MEQEGNIKLSIIIPYYKTKELTNKLLDILTPQITEEVEAVLIDDGCQEDFENIKVIHQENGGVSKARNTGIDNTTGEYIAFIDSDDMVSEKYVKTIIDKINSEPFDYCYISWKFQNGGTVIISDQPPIFNQSCWNCVVSRKAIGEERFKEGMNFAEDQDFNDRVRKGKRANITEVLYYYLANREDSLSRKHARGE
jgi:glycosyltransferase involved in cell wall biosynthesis